MCSAGRSTGLPLDEAEALLHLHGALLNKVADVVEGTASHFSSPLKWAATSAIIIAHVEQTALPDSMPREK